MIVVVLAAVTLDNTLLIALASSVFLMITPIAVSVITARQQRAWRREEWARQDALEGRISNKLDGISADLTAALDAQVDALEKQIAQLRAIVSDLTN